MSYLQFSLEKSKSRGADRRRHGRFLPPDINTSIIPSAGLLQLFGARGKPIDSSAVDISEGGMRACVKKPVKVKARIVVDFTLRRLNDHLRVRGRVLWIEAHPSMKGMYVVGVRFERLTKEQSRIVAGWHKYFSSPQARQRETLKREQLV